MCQRQTNYPAFWNALLLLGHLCRHQSQRQSGAVPWVLTPVQWSWGLESHYWWAGGYTMQKWLCKQPGTGNKPTSNWVCQWVWCELFPCLGFCFRAIAKVGAIERIFKIQLGCKASLCVPILVLEPEQGAVQKKKKKESRSHLLSPILPDFRHFPVLSLQMRTTYGDRWDNMRKALWT